MPGPVMAPESQRVEGTPAPAGVRFPSSAEVRRVRERIGLHLPGRRCGHGPRHRPPRRHERDRERRTSRRAPRPDRRQSGASHPRGRPSTCTPSASMGGTTSHWRWRAGRARPPLPATTPRPGRPPSARLRSSRTISRRGSSRSGFCSASTSSPAPSKSRSASTNRSQTMCWSTGSWQTATPSWAGMRRPRRRRSGCSTCDPATCPH